MDDTPLETNGKMNKTMICEFLEDHQLVYDLIFFLGGGEFKRKLFPRESINCKMIKAEQN